MEEARKDKGKSTKAGNERHGGRKTMKLLGSRDRCMKEMGGGEIVPPISIGGDGGECTLAARIHAAMDLESGRRH